MDKPNRLKKFVENDENASRKKNKQKTQNREDYQDKKKKGKEETKQEKERIVEKEDEEEVEVVTSEETSIDTDEEIARTNRMEEEEQIERSKKIEEREMDRNEILKQKRKEKIRELANICLEKNLPVTEENLKIVKKLIDRRKLEDQINNNKNIQSLQEKRKILEEIEFHEWADREKRIKELQLKKMKLLKTLVEKRDTERSEKIFYEIEKIMQNRDEKKEKIIEDYKKERERDLRNLCFQKTKISKFFFNEKGDAISEMDNYTSDYYLQLERNGKAPENLSEQAVHKIDNIPYNADLDQLDDMFNESNYTNGLKTNRQKGTLGTTSKYEDRKNKQLRGTLQRYMNKDEKRYDNVTNEYNLEDDSMKPDKQSKYLKLNFPKVHIKSKEEQHFEQCIIQLQSYLRGRALYKLMHDGIRDYADLIEELKLNEQIEKYSLEQKEKFEEEDFENVKIDAYVENMQGKYVSELLEKLSNELEKHEEERKIAVMVKYAERERRLRECKEKGKRQAEALLREKEDYLFNEIMGLNNQTVDSYLEDILSKTINDVSKDEAIKRTKEKAHQLNKIYNSLERNEENDKLVIKELVGNFMIPFVDDCRGLEFEELENKTNEYISNFATQNALSKIQNVS